MKGIMDLLVAAKLVTLSDEEMAQTEDNAPPLEEPAPLEVLKTEPEPPQVRPAECAPAPGKAFDELYREAGIPASPFPAERLLRLLDGLRAMDDATRKAAVRAMDDADEQWTIDDPILDAERKIQALESFRLALDADVSARKEQTAADMATLKAAQEQTSAEIRKQITELEKLLEREMQKTMDKLAALDTESKALERIAGAENARMQQEIARLQEIPAQFAPRLTHP